MPFANLLPFLLIATSNVLNVRSAIIDPAVSYEASPSAGGSINYTFPPTIAELAAAQSSLFPDESQIGYAGPTPTGDEPFAAQTAISAPMIADAYPLVAAPPYGVQDPNFDVLKMWGNLSPMQSIPSTDIPGATEIVPEGCELTQVHIVSRHGSRYPTTGSAPATFGQKLQAAVDNGTGFTAINELEFLNTWQYKLGAEILTPEGRLQLYRKGVKDAVLYGHLLKNYSLPLVAQSTTEDRMVESAQTYLQGFFGREDTSLSELVLQVEAEGFNNTYAPNYICNNTNTATGNLIGNVPTEWQNLYLQDALQRIQANIIGVEFTISDIYTMQQLCSYETVALGYSSFCNLFNVAEWEAYEYNIDLNFYYSNSFGSPVSAAMGLGYLQLLLSRLTQTPITSSNSSVNSTITSNPILFPLNQSIYWDFSHDTDISTFDVALNFTSFNYPAPLPVDHIPEHRAFNVFKISSFAASRVGQVMNCPTTVPNSAPAMEPYIRFLVNDAVVSLAGLGGCGYDSRGLCDLEVFISALMQRNAEIDFAYACFGNYTATTGQVTNGQPPAQ